MAKDVVFESEKYMQRQETLRKWMPLICLAAILLVVVVIALILRGSRGVVNTGGEDTPYPYSWSVDRKGVLTLEIDQTAAEGYSWTAADYDFTRLTIERPEKPKEGVSTFTITPEAAGRYICVFDLHSLQDRGDCKYEWRFLMDSAPVSEGETTSAGPLSILSGNGMDLGGKQHSAEDEEVSYTIHVDPDGNVAVEIINPELGRYVEEHDTYVPKDPDTLGPEDDDENSTAPNVSEPPAPLESTVITDPEEIEELLGMTLEEYIALQEAETITYSYQWTVTSENESAANPAGVFYTGEMAIATLNAGPEDGTASVSVHNDALGLEVYAVLENKEGRLSIVSYGSKSYEPVPFLDVDNPQPSWLLPEETVQP